MSAFGARLDAALDTRGSLCVGIDPHTTLLEQWGLSVDAAGLAQFAARCVDAFGEVAAVIKPQSAFFERFGSAGIAVLERTIADARAAGALVLLDVKRGDIGSTMAAYADAYLDPASPIAADAITVSPYLGIDSLAPAFDVATAHGGGVFVLAHTSNPEGPQFQHAVTASGRLVAQTVIDELADRNRDAAPAGSLGVVFGATAPDTGIELSRLNGAILAPGIGAQGGNVESVRRLFGDVLPWVLPAASREVLRTGPDESALRDATRRLIDEFGFLRKK